MGSGGYVGVNHPTMITRTLILLTLFACGAHTITAQQSYPEDDEFLNGNDMTVYFNSGGDMSWDLIGNPRFEVPKSSSLHTIFAGSLWIGGLDQSGGLHMAAHTYRQSGVDFWPGPKAAVYDSAYYARYGKVWKVRDDELAFHLSSWQKPNYTAPTDIETWPGNGDTLNGEPWLMAPFVDVNNNEVYEPYQGDYPAVKGTQTLYMVYSDAQFPNTETLGQSLEVDIHTLAYVYAGKNGEALDQTMFLSHKIVNRSNLALSDVYVGQWIDFDIGSGFDDFVGCDTLRDTFFGYNSDSLDGTATYGYLEHPPAQAVTFLNQEMTSFSSYNNDFSFYGNPETAPQYYGYLKGFWKNGAAFTQGGNGINGTTPTTFLYPGDPRDSGQWSEVSAGNPQSSDRRGIGTVGPFELGVGQSICLDMAFVFARADSGDHLTSVGEMYDRVDAIRAFADSSTLGCPLLQEEVLTGIQQLPDQDIGISIYPNPATSMLNVSLPEQGGVEVMDLYGRRIYLSPAEEREHTISVSDWPPGTYFVLVDIGDSQYSSQVLVYK